MLSWQGIRKLFTLELFVPEKSGILQLLNSQELLVVTNSVSVFVLVAEFPSIFVFKFKLVTATVV